MWAKPAYNYRYTQVLSTMSCVDEKDASGNFLELQAIEQFRISPLANPTSCLDDHGFAKVPVLFWRPQFYSASSKFKYKSF